ncbi:MAG TPA: HAD-IC family P-type ATPase, partial [Longimicrobiales bacterium]|nr:HAD-IC family P-type ATPase [Longimicrobiales bacterium]
MIPARSPATPADAPERPWHALAASEARAVLDSPTDGLAEAEAARRLAEVGPNEVAAERVTPWWVLLLRQFRDPLVYILLIAAVVTLALRDFTDMGVIVAVVALNAIIGFVQELRAREAILGLARLSAPRAEVLRDGQPRSIGSRELVPGDVVLVASGSRVPADVRLEMARDLEVDESALTGESMPSRKTVEALEGAALVPGDRWNMGFAGTMVTRGRGRGIVVRTGMATELGRIAATLRDVGSTATPLQERTERFGRQVGVAVLVLSLVVVVAGLARGLPAGEIFLAAVALAVSAIPEGLPVVLTVTLAIGVGRMARRQAIIRSLPAVETLGSTTLIGSDKTGTLTKNEMTVRGIWAGGAQYQVTGAGYVPEGRVERDGRAADPHADAALRMTLLAGVLANEAAAGGIERGEPQGDPTEIALLVAAAKAGLSPSSVRASWTELDVLPFEPERRFMAALAAGPDGERLIFMKGAPEVVAARCDRMAMAVDTQPMDEETVARAAAELSGRGLRVLAMAWRPGEAAGADLAAEGGFVFAGLQGMEDPVRPEAIAAVRAAKEAGIRVIMLTGDHVATARAIGRQLGLGGPEGAAMEGHELEFLSDEEMQHT